MSNQFSEDYFFCYRGPNTAVAEEFYNYIRGHRKYSQLHVWFSEIRPVGNYKRDIKAALRKARGAVLFLASGFTRNFLNDEPSEFECITALEIIEIARRKLLDDSFLILTVNVDGYTFSEQDLRVIRQLLQNAQLPDVDAALDGLMQNQKNTYFPAMHLEERDSYWGRLADVLLKHRNAEGKPVRPRSPRKWLIRAAAVAAALVLTACAFVARGRDTSDSSFIPAGYAYVQPATDAAPPDLREQDLDDLLLRARNDHLSKLLADDPQAGIAALQAEAESGNPEAMYMLGTAYYWGEAVEQDVHKAFEWLYAAARLQHAESYTIIGLMYATGTGIAKDEQMAIEFFRLGAEGGSSTAANCMNVLLLNNPDTAPESLQWFKAAADAGDTEAMCVYGSMLLYGISGLEADVDTAIGYYTKAAEAGNAVAMLNLADLYFYGDVIAVDYQQARHWYKQVIQASNAEPDQQSEAMVMLGYLYSCGLGGKQSSTEAFLLYQNAADLGNTLGVVNLAICYCNGECVSRDYAKTLELFQRSAAMGDIYSMTMLGDMYHLALGTPRDDAQSFRYYFQAAEAGSSYGMMKAGFCYQEGRGIAKNPALAAAWYHKAIEVADEHTYYPLGSILLKGVEGILERDPEKGYQLLLCAAETGHAEAIDFLNQALEKGAIALPTSTGQQITRLEFRDGSLQVFTQD